MIDDPRLEARLRDDPTGDPPYVSGRFRDRTTRTSTQRVGSRLRVSASRQAGALVAAALLIAVAVLARISIDVGPRPTPSPSPSPSPTETLDIGALRDVLAAWATANGVASVSVSVVDRRGDLQTIRLGAPDQESKVRLGELSEIFVAGGIVGLYECTTDGVPGFTCPTTPEVERFGLDDPVVAWLPDTQLDRAITLRHLLDGSSGLAEVGPTVADLSRAVAGDPGRDWSRAAVLAAALHQPVRFAPGARREPVDTEFFLLEDVIGAIDKRDPGLWIDGVAAHGFGDQQQGSWTRPTVLAPGGVPGMRDLDPKVLGIVHDAAGMWGSSQGLAQSAVETWGSTIVHASQGIDVLTDAAHGHADPIAAVGLCPCAGETRAVIGRTGHAVAWSSGAAYDLDRHVSIGFVVLSDVPDDALLDLINRLDAGIRG